MHGSHRERPTRQRWSLPSGPVEPSRGRRSRSGRATSMMLLGTTLITNGLLSWLTWPTSSTA